MLCLASFVFLSFLNMFTTPVICRTYYYSKNKIFFFCFSFSCQNLYLKHALLSWEMKKVWIPFTSTKFGTNLCLIYITAVMLKSELKKTDNLLKWAKQLWTHVLCPWICVVTFCYSSYTISVQCYSLALNVATP